MEVYLQHTDSPTSHEQTHSMVTATSSPTESQQSTGSFGKPVFILVYLFLWLSLNIYIICTDLKSISLYIISAMLLCLL